MLSTVQQRHGRMQEMFTVSQVTDRRHLQHASITETLSRNPQAPRLRRPAEEAEGALRGPPVAATLRAQRVATVRPAQRVGLEERLRVAAPLLRRALLLQVCKANPASSGRSSL